MKFLLLLCLIFSSYAIKTSDNSCSRFRTADVCVQRKCAEDPEALRRFVWFLVKEYMSVQDENFKVCRFNNDSKKTENSEKCSPIGEKIHAIMSDAETDDQKVGCVEISGSQNQGFDFAVAERLQFTVSVSCIGPKKILTSIGWDNKEQLRCGYHLVKRTEEEVRKIVNHGPSDLLEPSVLPQTVEKPEPEVSSLSSFTSLNNTNATDGMSNSGVKVKGAAPCEASDSCGDNEQEKNRKKIKHGIKVVAMIVACVLFFSIIGLLIATVLSVSGAAPFHY